MTHDYSLGFAYDDYEAGLTPEQYVAEVRACPQRV